ncbi:MAG: hypothetical protein KUG77_22070, partial [Nannocystaceae bacterium]|nr:hypothetical protein [Nannocystaceae bacterium]
KMQNMRKFGWVSLLAASVALGGCDDDSDDSSSSAATMTMTATATEGSTDTDAVTGDTDPTGEDESSSGGEVDCSSPPSHAADIQPLWDANCVDGCHEPGGVWMSTDLSPGAAYDALVDADGIQTMALSDVSLVIPEDTANSYLLNKLLGSQGDIAGAAAGTRMPQGEGGADVPALSDGDIDLVVQWVACGAEE